MCLFSHRDVLPENLVKITPQILQKVHFWLTCVETWDRSLEQVTKSGLLTANQVINVWYNYYYSANRRLSYASFFKIDTI